MSESVLMLGSCFAEEIGRKLSERKFKVLLNPHGIVYNPLSLAKSLHEYMDAKEYVQGDLFLHDGLWRSLHHHGRFAHSDASLSLTQINREITKAHTQLIHAKWLIITWGSAFAYMHEKQVVANCHKLPAQSFHKTLLSKEEILSVWRALLSRLKQFNPDLNVLFTVSPVRYLRDGLVGNNRSKGILLDVIHTLTEEMEACLYFPAYEIVIDQLRDYRFFKEDMLHPNELAIKYVWQKFVETAFDTETKQFIEAYEPLLKSLQHRDLHADNTAHLHFKQQLQEKLKSLQQRYPDIDLS